LLKGWGKAGPKGHSFRTVSVPTDAGGQNNAQINLWHLIVLVFGWGVDYVWYTQPFPSMFTLACELQLYAVQKENNAVFLIKVYQLQWIQTYKLIKFT